MRLCVLSSSYEQSTSELRELDPSGDPSPYLLDNVVDAVTIEKATAAQQIRDLVLRGYDAFINLCDGAADEDSAGVEVVRELERWGAAFTGAGSAFYEPTRAAMKAACLRAGVGTPRFAFAADADGAARAAEALRFPVIVKHPNSYCSVGMTRASRVEAPEALEERVEQMSRAFGGALVEEFIEGREFSVLIAEPPDGEAAPRAYQPVEIVFPPGETFKHFELKWIDFDRVGWTPLGDPELADRLVDASRRLFTALDGSGYGRCDLRMDRAGQLFMLEINPNCGIFYPAGAFGSSDIILSHDPAGHRGFLEHLLRCAERRRRAAG